MKQNVKPKRCKCDHTGAALPDQAAIDEISKQCGTDVELTLKWNCEKCGGLMYRQFDSERNLLVKPQAIV